MRDSISTEEQPYFYASISSALVPSRLAFVFKNHLVCNSGCSLVNRIDRCVNLLRLLNGSKVMLISGLSAILHVKNDCQHYKSMRFPENPAIMEDHPQVQWSNPHDRHDTQVHLLQTDVSGWNGSSCHLIKSPKAE